MDGIDTIAAIATAPGRAGVAVVRVSGPDSFAIASMVARVPVPGGAGEKLPSVRHLRFFDPASGKPVDDGLLVAFATPHSFTGEDVVELQCHGGVIAPRRVLEACLAAGARLARRGEFTERALLNGKLDYSQAEGLLALVDALTDRAADAALAGATGAGSKALRELYDHAIELSARIEHALDVSEDELPEGFKREIEDSVNVLLRLCRAEIIRAREGRMLRDGAKVVLSGPPNVGKSSLFNVLVGSSRAIVSETPGTTRDSIEAWIDISGWPICLVDTAGIRAAGDAVEEEGVKRAKSLAAAADIVLELHNAVQDVHTDKTSDFSQKIIVFTKCDLYPQGDCPPRSPGTVPLGVSVSAVTGEGIEQLKSAISTLLEAKADEVCESSGDDRANRLCEVEGLLSRVSADDLVLAANGVRDAASRLGTLIGAEYSADLLDALFSKFCVGK